MTENNKKPIHFNIDVRDVLNIFQIQNPEVLVVSKDKTEIGNIYNNMAAMMKRFGASSTHVLENADAMRYITVASASSDSGGFMMASIVETVSAEAEIEKWLILIQGEVADFGADIEDPAQRYKLRPNFILSGVVEHESNLKTHDCIARLKTNDNNILVMRPENMDDYCAIMLYGDAAFRAMMTHDEIDIDKFAFYLDPSLRQAAKHEYDVIRKRTATDLAGYIVECADEEPIQLKPNTVIAAPPPILQ